jgi:hypothetical protein
LLSFDNKPFSIPGQNRTDISAIQVLVPLCRLISQKIIDISEKRCIIKIV